MAQLLSTWIDGFVGSAKATGAKVMNAFGKVIPEMKQYFTSGFMGKGWQIFKSGGTDENPEFTLEIDSIKVRKALVAHELIVEQIRAICGSLGISQACGKVKSVAENETFYFLNMEGEAIHGYGGFAAGDLVRCQRLTANGINGYWVQVTKIVENESGYNLVIPKDQFTNGNIYQQTSGDDADNVDTTKATGIAMCAPEAGDNLVQYGNVSDTTRQSAIYIHADGMGRPAIDMLEKINSRSFAGKMVCRLGGELPEGGFGFYCENGKIISTNGAETNYRFSPDGTFELGKGAITYKDGVVTLAPEVVINWGATSQANVQYCLSESGSVQPTTGWSDTMPTLEEGKFLWTRTKFPDATYTYSVSYYPKDGENGTSIKVKGTKESVDQLPTPPEDASDCYIVAKDLYVWDGTSWQNVGQFKGDKGDKGVGVVSVKTLYALGVSAKVEPEDISFIYDEISVVAISVNADKYLWSANQVTYTNKATSLMGKTFLGKCKELTSVTEQYGTSTSNITQPSSWVDNEFPTGLAEGTWIWSRNKITWKNGSITYSDAQIKGYIAKKGDKGDKGDDGVSLRPNLLDYTALTEETFNNPPTGLVISGIRTKDVPDGCGGIYTDNELTTDYEELFREDILSKLSPNTKYTISFLLRKIDKSGEDKAKFAVILYTGTSEAEFINLSKSVIINGEERILTSNVISLEHSGGAYTRYTITFTTATSLSSLEHAYFLWRRYKGSGGLILAQMKVERGTSASEWCLSETDKFVALPSWVRQWDGTATQVGSTYIVSPNAFFGKKESSDTSITGIYLSSDSLTIDGEQRTGLYAFDKGEVKVIIDPTKGQYKFVGEVEATSGKFTGEVVATSGKFTGEIEATSGSFSGTIKGVSGTFKDLKCINDEGTVVGSLQFGDSGRIWLEGDLFHNGYDYTKKRGYRIYANNIFCRGMFGHHARTTAVVYNDFMMVYGRDDSISTGTLVNLESAHSSDGKTYYKIPLYGYEKDDISGMPIDMVIFYATIDAYYQFTHMGNGKEFRVLRATDKNVCYCDMSGWHKMDFGTFESIMYVDLALFYTEGAIKELLGKGIFRLGQNYNF